MKISGRLALAMVLLVVVTSCIVSAFAYYFLAEAAPRAVLTSIISAALAGGGIAAVLAIALAVGITNVLLKPPPAAKPAIAGAEAEQARAYQALADRERMAQAIVENALDAFVQTDESCVILDWSPHAEALMGWTRAEAVGRSVEELVFPESLRVVHRQWVDQFPERGRRRRGRRAIRNAAAAKGRPRILRRGFAHGAAPQ